MYGVLILSIYLQKAQLVEDLFDKYKLNLTVFLVVNATLVLGSDIHFYLCIKHMKLINKYPEITILTKVNR